MSAPIIACAVKIYGNAGNRRGELIAKPTALHVAGDMQPVNRRCIVAVDTETHIVVLAVALGLTDRNGHSCFGVIGSVSHFDKCADFRTLQIDGIPQQSRNHIGFKVAADIQVIPSDSCCSKRPRLTYALPGFHRCINQEFVSRKHRGGRSNARLHQRVRLIIHFVAAWTIRFRYRIRIWVRSRCWSLLFNGCDKQFISLH